MLTIDVLPLLTKLYGIFLNISKTDTEILEEK